MVTLDHPITGWSPRRRSWRKEILLKKTLNSLTFTTRGEKKGGHQGGGRRGRRLENKGYPESPATGGKDRGNIYQLEKKDLVTGEKGT